MKTEQELRALAITRHRHLVEHLKRAHTLAYRQVLGAIDKRDMDSLRATVEHVQHCFYEFAVLSNVLEKPPVT